MIKLGRYRQIAMGVLIHELQSEYLIMNPLGDQNICPQYREFIFSELDLILILCRVLYHVLVHNTRMFIISYLDCVQWEYVYVCR